ncbi:hypothetical protein V6N13_021991 [Hibiscus sabdariffa]|uniref:Cystatin domain-containing protein n=1 Tax=Hibiscus sabdariffa TaxID=183260 RepID=A0ABR2CQA3_9ROSI
MSESKRGEENRKVYEDHDSDDEGISRVDLMKYEAEVEASGGYDVGEYVSNLCGMIHPITVNRWEDLPSYAEMAVDHYNEHNHTNFKVVELLKANIGVVSGFMFYITFKVEESNTGKTETFQARVWSKIRGPNGEDRVEIIQCRIKASCPVEKQQISASPTVELEAKSGGEAAPKTVPKPTTSGA